MMKTKVVAALLVGVALAAGCEGPQSGRVTRRDHTPAYTTFVQTCFSWAGTGTTRYCAAWIPVPLHHSESCELYLVDESTGKHGWRDVPCATFDRYAVGTTYP